jgi:hypothetical protein
LGRKLLQWRVMSSSHFEGRHYIDMSLRQQSLSRLSAKTKTGFSATTTTLDSVTKTTAGELIPSNPNLASATERVAALPLTEPGIEHCKDLWEKAYFRLRTEKKGLVETYEAVLVKNKDISDGLPLTKKMSTVITQELRILTNRQWKIRIPLLHEPVVVRNVVDKIVNVVLMGKDLASVAASLDPIHAGLPFAGICVLLPVSDLHLQLLRQCSVD